jgi:hypothetical protein
MLLSLAATCGLAGCAGSGGSTMKERGVYTTLAMEGKSLDLPGSGYTTYKTFGPGQTPAAVVIGYGYWDGTYNHPQQFDLQVIENATGAVILDTSGFEYADRVAVIDLPIRKSGNYQLKLLVNNSVYDTWDFTVDRGAPTEDAAKTPSPGYAKGTFAVGLTTQDESTNFASYNSYLVNAVSDAVQRAANKADQAIFSQVPAGKVVVGFQLDDAGNVGSPQVLENTLNDALAQFFLRALQDVGQFKPWSAEEHTRHLKLTFHYE